jgi:hypothetical protein
MRMLQDKSTAYAEHDTQARSRPLSDVDESA